MFRSFERSRTKFRLFEKGATIVRGITMFVSFGEKVPLLRKIAMVQAPIIQQVCQPLLPRLNRGRGPHRALPCLH